jgi:hypothetical protein
MVMNEHGVYGIGIASKKEQRLGSSDRWMDGHYTTGRNVERIPYSLDVLTVERNEKLKVLRGSSV